MTWRSEGPWGGFLFGNKRHTFARRKLFALFPFALSPFCLPELRLVAGAAIWGSRGSKQEANASPQGQRNGKMRRAWGRVPVLCTLPELPTSVLSVVEDNKFLPV